MMRLSICITTARINKTNYWLMIKKQPCVTDYLDCREAYVIAKHKFNAAEAALCLQLRATPGLNLEMAILDERNRRNSPHRSAVENYGKLLTSYQNASEIHDIARDLQQRKMQNLEDFDCSPLQISRK